MKHYEGVEFFMKAKSSKALGYAVVLSKLLATDLNLNGTLIEQGTQISTAVRSADEIPSRPGT